MKLSSFSRQAAKAAILAAFAALALPSPAAQTGHAVYRPGLTQARIPLGSEWGYKNTSILVPNLSSNLLGLIEEGHADWLDRTLDVFKDGQHKKGNERDTDPNPLSGRSWPWSEAIRNSHGVFAYEGEMFVEEGMEYYFFGRMYTGEALVVDGTTVVWQGDGNSYNGAPEIHGFWTAPKTGWVPFNGWLWTWSGGSGDPQWSEWGLQYNIAGFSLKGLGEETALYSPPPNMQGIRYYSRNEYTNVWKRFVDPGNGTFLRTVTTNRFTTATTTDGHTWNLTFSGVPHAAQLVAFTGALDGIHDTNAWDAASGVLAEVSAGDSPLTQVTVAPAAGATALRFRLAHADETATDGLEVFEEWTAAFPLSNAPVVRVDAVRPGFTNAVVEGCLASLGLDGEPATVTVRIENPADGSLVATTNLPVFDAPGPFEVVVEGLATDTVYRATAVAAATVSSESGAVGFRTSRPTAATASAEVVSARFFEAELAAVVSDWGAGAAWADAWIEVAPDDSFAADQIRTVSLGRLSGHLPATHVGTVEDIPPGTDYRARVRLRNSWGLESVSPSVEMRTSDVPLVFSDPVTSAATRWASVSLAPSYVATGTVYTVALDADGPGFTGLQQTWDGQTGFGPFEWGHTTVSGARVTFKFTISWTNGVLGSGDNPIVVTADTMWSSAAEHAMTLAELDAFTVHPGRTNLYLRPGGTVELIPSTNGVSFAWHTNAVLSVSTNGIITALEPGAALIYEQDSSGKTNNVFGAVIVLPAEDPEGGIYLHRELNNPTWTDPDEWEMIAPGPQGYPDAPGAIAYVVTPAVYTYHDYLRTMEIPKRITLGGLVVGQLGWIHHDKSQWSVCYWLFTDSNEEEGELVFDTGNPGVDSWIRLAGHSYITSFVKINVPISMENDLEIDEMNRVQDEILLSQGDTNVNSSRERGLYIQKPVDVGSHTLRTVRTHAFPYHYGSSGSGLELCGWVSFRNDIRGSGTIRLEAATQIGLTGYDDEGRVKSFSGVWDVANGDLNPHINSQYGAASLNLCGGSLGNAKEMILRGSWHRAEKTWPRGALVRTGFENSRWDNSHRTVNAWTNDWQDALPPKITLDGGCLQLYPQGSGANSSWRNVFTITDLTIKAGPMGRLESKHKDKSGNYLSGVPNVFTTIANLDLEGDAVISFEHDARNSTFTNEFVIVNESENWGWVPGPEANQQFLPFFFANNEREGTGGNTIEGMSVTTIDNTHLAFRNRTTGKVVVTNTVDVGGGYKRWTAGETLVDGTNYISMQLAQNVTNAFAAGATVRNLAGYVDLRKGAMLGRLGNDAGATLDFGDQPARIFNGNWGEVGTIGCRLAGSAGLVTGGNGTVALGASADGVSGGVRVAGGTLALGAFDGSGKLHPGRVAGDVVVEAGSRLVARSQLAFAQHVRLFLNDRDWIPSYARVRIDSKAYVDEIFVDGKPLRHGWYGSSDSDATFVDDVHFEGAGMIHCGALPTMMIFR